MKKNQEKIERLNLVLRTIRNVNQLLVKERNRNKLLKGVCRNLVKNRGYYNAWIAVFGEDGGLVANAQAGLGKEFSSMVELLKNGKLTDCAQKAMSQKGVVVTEDPLSSCTDCPLATNYSGRGAMTVQLEHGGKVFGILSVSIPKHFLAEEEERSLLEEVARDIAFALHSIEMEEEREQAEEVLRESEKRYRSVFENTGAATFIIEEDMTISMINTKFERLSGYSKKEVEGKMKWTEFVAEEDLKRMKEYHFKRRKNERSAPTEYEFRFIDKNGSLKDIFCKIGLIPGTKRSVGSLMDITSLKQAEEALRESEQRFRDLVESSLIGISIIQEGRIVYQNPEQKRIQGPFHTSFKPSDFKNIHPDDVEKVRRLYQSIMSGEVQTLETDFRFYPPGLRDSKHDMKWVYCRTSLIEYQGKEAILVNMMNITRSKELEHLLIIQDKMASLGRVAAGIAHEIRNPLTGINMYLDILKKILDKPEDLEDGKEILGQIQSASNRIESVIRRVTDFSKSSEPKLALKDINQPIEDAIRLSSVTLRKRDIKIDKKLAGNLPLCHIDLPLIEEVILNLINNAAEAMKNMDGEKKIEIASSVENNLLFVRVSDSGPGVPLNLRDKIFEPFYTTKKDSTGIGLSLVHRIITDHGGSIEVNTSKWRGAEFKIKIPIDKD